MEKYQWKRLKNKWKNSCGNDQQTWLWKTFSGSQILGITSVTKLHLSGHHYYHSPGMKGQMTNPFRSYQRLLRSKTKDGGEISSDNVLALLVLEVKTINKVTCGQSACSTVKFAKLQVYKPLKLATWA